MSLLRVATYNINCCRDYIDAWGDKSPRAIADFIVEEVFHLQTAGAVIQIYRKESERSRKLPGNAGSTGKALEQAVLSGQIQHGDQENSFVVVVGIDSGGKIHTGFQNNIRKCQNDNCSENFRIWAERTYLRGCILSI